MDTNHLKVLLTYSKTENLRMTAELHHTSHVGVIRALRTLEEELGVKMTTRVGRGSMLTKEAKGLLKYAEKIINDEQNLLMNAKNESIIKNELIISTFEVFSTHLAPEINEALGLERKITWVEKIPGEIESSIKSGLSDIGITYLPIPTPEVEHLKVSTIKMGVFQVKHQNFEAQPKEKIPFVVPHQEEFITPSKAKGLDGWQDYKFPRNIHYRVSMLETALAITAAGQCVGYFPKFVVEKYNESGRKNSLIEVPGFRAQESTQDIFLVKRVTDEESLLVKKVVKVLRKLK